MGPIVNPAAEDLWFCRMDAQTSARVEHTLRALQVAYSRDDTAIRVPVYATVGAMVDLVAQGLSAEQQACVRVAWTISGVGRAAAERQDMSLATFLQRVEHRWFTQLLDERRLFMHFQPIVRLGAPEIHAHEALVRADHAGRTLSGFEIISMAEQLELIVPLDARTRTLAIEQFSATELRSKLFINFQPSAIYNPEFCLLTTFQALERSRLRPEDVVFEVVESEEIHDTLHLLRIMHMYRMHGMGVALDDYGTGHSTGERLANLRPDYLKLDKSLTRDIASNPEAQETIAAIMHDAVRIDCQVIAEGIETVAQRDALRALGIPYGQGYLFARPARDPRVTWPD
jgi:EAL domain-containing protein (putative c-di-GMP-specific phosphodiesterase class I)